MKYALAKFRVYLLGSRPFVVYTDHASLRTAVKSPHISQRMARWLSFFAEYDFRVEYKPGRLNVVADALSRRPDFAVKTADANRIGVESVSTPSSSLIDDMKAAYASDADAKQLLSYASAPSDEARRKLAPHLRARAHRYRVHERLLLYAHWTTMRIVSSCRTTMICGFGSCTSTTMPLRQGILVVRRHTCFSRVTSTGITSTSGCTSTFVLARCVNAWSLLRFCRLHFRHHRSVGSPSLWILSLVFRLTVSGGLVSWSL
ncbi:hypothetical protein PC123_g28309 [Phytophthora cactorum]|nr:hypothetical protein PC123_g28309 [Phytophthora cactorum]